MPKSTIVGCTSNVTICSAFGPVKSLADMFAHGAVVKFPDAS